MVEINICLIKKKSTISFSSLHRHPPFFPFLSHLGFRALAPCSFREEATLPCDPKMEQPITVPDVHGRSLSFLMYLFIYLFSVGLLRSQHNTERKAPQPHASQPAPSGAPVKLQGHCLCAECWPRSKGLAPRSRPQRRVWKWTDHAAANARQRPKSSFLAPPPS